MWFLRPRPVFLCVERSRLDGVRHDELPDPAVAGCQARLSVTVLSREDGTRTIQAVMLIT